MPETRDIIPKSAAVGPFYVGVDLGGTSCKVGVTDDRGETLSWLSVPTRVAEGGEAGAARIGAGVLEAIAAAGLSRDEISGVGMGAPGTMDVPAGKLVKPNNLKGWNDFPIRDRVAHHCGFPVIFANDANAAAYGEFWIGSGKEYDSLVLFTLGTGVGGGIILGDLMIDGATSHGGELGHIPVDTSPTARLCSCGQRGHLEAYASATGLTARTREALDRGEASALQDRLAAGERLTALLIAQACEAGDALAERLILETAHYLGIGVVTALHTIDPQAIVIGGGMTFGRDETALGRRFLAEVKKTIDRFAFPVVAERIVLRYAELGGDAGYIGAAGRARVAHRLRLGKGA